MECVQDLLAPGASNFYAVNDFLGAAGSQAPTKAFTFSGLMSDKQVSASAAMPGLKHKPCERQHVFLQTCDQSALNDPVVADPESSTIFGLRCASMVAGIMPLQTTSQYTLHSHQLTAVQSDVALSDVEVTSPVKQTVAQWVFPLVMWQSGITDLQSVCEEQQGTHYWHAYAVQQWRAGSFAGS